MKTDSRVADYISQLPGWQQAVVLQGNICALLAARDHVNVFIYDPAVADPHGVINQGHWRRIQASRVTAQD